MAVYKIFPTSDSTIYSQYPDMNSGIDPILELKNVNTMHSNGPQVSRSLLRFNTQSITEITSNITDYEANIKLYIANASNTGFDFKIDIHSLTQAWVNGTGVSMDLPQTTNGVTWNTYDSENNWVSLGGDYDSTKVEVDITYGSKRDINAPITDMVKNWVSNPSANYGLILKLEDSVEFNTSRSKQPDLRYFGVDTHTIYPPCLEIKWDDSSYNPGSLKPIDSNDIFLSLSNNPGVFNENYINRFRINVRPQFPEREYKTTSFFTENHALPIETYYAVKDLDTNEFVIEFDDEYTKVSCDSSSNYFDLNMHGLQPERYYKILIKTVIDGSTIIKDDKYYFKITKG